jgi:hypothetical protein
MNYKLVILSLVLFCGCKNNDDNDDIFKVKPIDYSQIDTTWRQTFRRWDNNDGRWEMRTSVIITTPYSHDIFYGRSGEIELQSNGKYKYIDRVFDTTVIGTYNFIVSVRSKFAKMANDTLNDLKAKKREWEAHQKREQDTLNLLNQPQPPK